MKNGGRSRSRGNPAAMACVADSEERLQDDEAAVRELEAAYDRAWDDGDLGSLVASFTADATVIDPFGGVSSGRAEISRLFAELLAGRGRGSTHTSTIHSVRFVAPNVALADGEAVIGGLRGPDGAALPPLVHRFTDVLTRDGDAWHIAEVRAYVLMSGPRP